MTSLYIFIGIVAFFAIALFISNAIHRKKGITQTRETEEPVIKINLSSDSGLCCGSHEVCEKDTLIATFDEEPEYFDDEELDRFRHREADSFNNDEVDEFREVFYTIIDEEKPKWIRSLQLRDIAVPNQLKDEIVLIVRDLREAKMEHA